MSYLLDTCTLCEPTRKAPDGNVITWFDKQREGDLYLSVLTIGEIAAGVTRLEDSRKKHRLKKWLHRDLPERFAGRILDITPKICIKWGEITGSKKKTGVQIPVIDGLLAATGIIHSLTLVTRNTDDFMVAELPVFNPWEGV